MVKQRWPIPPVTEKRPSLIAVQAAYQTERQLYWIPIYKIFIVCFALLTILAYSFLYKACKEKETLWQQLKECQGKFSN